MFALHGTPGSLFNRHYDETRYVEVGARVLTYDRPGYGGSDRHPGRRVVDCVDDVAELADALGIERFAVFGFSLGGPHALALAARLSSRVTRVASAAAVAPYDAQGLDFFDGMDPLNVKEFGWALGGETTLVRELEREAAGIRDRVAGDPAKIWGDDWELPEADRAEWARTERQDVIRQSVSDAFSAGVWGWVDDDLCFVKPWGFDVSEISVPTCLIYGTTDVFVPRQHGDWLARMVPGAEAVVAEGQGHMLDPELVIERYAWLVRAT